MAQTDTIDRTLDLTMHVPEPLDGPVISIRPTADITEILGVTTRAWVGTTPSGGTVVLLVACIACGDDDAAAHADLAPIDDRLSPVDLTRALS